MNFTVPALAAVMLVGGFGGWYAGMGWVPDAAAASEACVNDQKEPPWELFVERDTVFIGSATILSIVVFGTGLSVAFRYRMTELGAVMLVIGVAVTTTSSLFLMYIACCESGLLWQVTFMMVILSGGVFLVLFGHGHTLDKHKSSGRDTPTDSSQAEGKTLG